MALSRRSGSRMAANIWPGFVDAMTALLLVVMFVLTIFMIVQFALRETVTGQEETITGQEEKITDQETELSDLNAQISGLADALGLERLRGAALTDSLNTAQNDMQLQATLITSLNNERDEAAARIALFEQQVAAQTASISDLEAVRDQEISAKEAAELALARARSEIEIGAVEARFAAAKAEALEALIADLETKVEDTNTALETLSGAEKARIVEAAAAEALRARLAGADTELTAMTLALEEQRRKAEDTLTLLAAAEAAQKNLGASQQESVTEITRQKALLAQAQNLLSDERDISDEARRQVALLNQQTAALRQQLGNLQTVLDESEEKDRQANVQLQTLGTDLNAALARVAAEQKARATLEARERERLEAEAIDLRSFRSEFFGRVRAVLGEREGVRVVGDRFVFSSEVLFAPGSAELGAGGKAQIARVAEVIRDIGDEIPSEINWVLRVDGHTDKIQIGRGSAFSDNWELSQARALSVVKYLINHEGIPANRLAATGFGEFQPIDTGDSPEALALNRRIELKLTEK
ncbi:MAG: peptidoglycan -binding protein [Paracoccaceae bacterium]